MPYVRTVLILLVLALGATAAHATGPWFDPYGLQKTGSLWDSGLSPSVSD